MRKCECGGIDEQNSILKGVEPKEGSVTLTAAIEAQDVDSYPQAQTSSAKVRELLVRSEFRELAARGHVTLSSGNPSLQASCYPW